MVHLIIKSLHHQSTLTHLLDEQPVLVGKVLSTTVSKKEYVGHTKGILLTRSPLGELPAYRISFMSNALPDIHGRFELIADTIFDTILCYVPEDGVELHYTAHGREKRAKNRLFLNENISLYFGERKDDLLGEFEISIEKK